MKLARPGAFVLAFFLSVFVFLASGRLASLDAGHQLQASTMLALTGQLGDATPGDGPSSEAWVRAPNGSLYEAHDVGNVLLMLPAAWIGAQVSSASEAEDMLAPPPLSRVLVSLTCAVVAAAGCAWLYQAFVLFTSPRAAFLLAAAFPATTIFIAYARSAWDVLGGAAAMCGVLCFSGRLAKDVRPERSAVMAAALLALLGTFRFSLLPFMAPAMAALFWSARSSLTRRATVSAAATFAALMVPSLVYNYVRTGSPIRPATATAQYLNGNNSLDGNVAAGLFGLLLSPNRGLFVFCPVLLAVIVAALLWRRQAPAQRLLVACYGAGSVAYTLLIASMANWGAFGWGPRYLVPVLPVAFFAAAPGLEHLFRTARGAGIAIVTLSTLLTLPAAVVNWHLATTSFPGAADPFAPRPFQLAAGWQALRLGVSGDRTFFPDLLVARAAEHSAGGLIVAAVAAIGAVLVAAFSATRLLNDASYRVDPQR